MQNSQQCVLTQVMCFYGKFEDQKFLSNEFFMQITVNLSFWGVLQFICISVGGQVTVFIGIGRVYTIPAEIK